MKSFKEDIEQNLEQIQQMQELYRQVRDLEILPISFFSAAYDVLKSLTTALHEMEAAQLVAMKEHLFKHESIMIETGLFPENCDTDSNAESEPYVEEFVKLDTVVEAGFLGDVISKKLVTDLKKALSLNDRFRFQKNLFNGDTRRMNDTLDRLNGFTCLDEAIKFLDNQFQWNWEDGSAAEFREILEKRFS